MTNEQIEAIRNRAEKSAVGKWEFNRDENEILCGSYTIARDFEYEADAIFIANAREDIPALLAEVDHLRKVIVYEKSRNETLELTLQHYRGYA